MSGRTMNTATAFDPSCVREKGRLHFARSPMDGPVFPARDGAVQWCVDIMEENHLRMVRSLSPWSNPTRVADLDKRKNFSDKLSTFLTRSKLSGRPAGSSPSLTPFSHRYNFLIMSRPQIRGQNPGFLANSYYEN